MKVGAAFSEHIKVEKISRKHSNPEVQYSMRPLVLLVFLFIFPTVLFLKLVNLQLVHGTYYRDLADNNRTRTKVIHAPRGVIFDRNGRPLVYNIPGFREVKNKRATLLTQEKAIELLSAGREDLEIDTLRQYPLKDASAHVLGYIGQISEQELSMPEYGGYNGTDLIGKTGLEQFYEHVLKGIDGKELIEADAHGRRVRTLGQTDPVPGKDITVTIDAKLQTASFEALKDQKKGVVIASTPTGEILSMVSVPSFDTNMFTMGETYEASKSGYPSVASVILDGENQPMLNRAIGGVYPPGSTFKLITAAAGLEEKVITRKFTVEDTGIIHVGEFSFANWFYLEQGRKDGTVDVVKAISRSNDIFFYKLAEMVKVDRLSSFGAKFGLGKQLGIDLAGETKGILPTDEWKKRVIGEQWYLGDSYHYGIGQGYLLTTPLQVNAWTTTIANGGELYKPRLLKNSKLEVLNSKFLSEDTVSLIRQGMVDSCEPGGVGWPLFSFKVPAYSKASAGKKNENLPIDGKNFITVHDASSSAAIKDWVEIPVACKTGTAQHGGEETLPHAWITLFAPAYDPEIVVTVLVESSGQGSNVAAPVAKKVLEAWFTR